MFRKITVVTVLAMLTSLAVYADIVMDATPSNDNGANLNSDGTLVATAGQTFTTGTLVYNELAWIKIDGPLKQGSLTNYYLAVYVDADQNAATWGVDTLVAVSTNMASMDTGTLGNTWEFDLPELVDNTVYAFVFTTDPEGTTTPVGFARPGMRGKTNPYAGGTVFGSGTPQFSNNYDIAAKIKTGTDPEVSIVSFTASKTVVNEGDSVTLSWETEGATTLTLDPGGIDVTGSTSTVVVVASSATNTLTAAKGEDIKTASIFILAYPPVVNGQVATRFGTVTGADDADQAGPLYGQSITINVGANIDDALISQTLRLLEVSFQNSGSGSSANTNATAYMHVYDDFVVDNTGVPTTIGNLIAVSTNTVDFTTSEKLAKLTWRFNQELVDKATIYYYLPANGTIAATVENYVDVLKSATSGYELKTGDKYPGGRAFAANNFNVAAANWDLEFELITSDTLPGDAVTDFVITGLIDSGTQMVFSWTGEAGKAYGVETNSNLLIGDWQTFMTGLPGNGGTMFITNSIGPDRTFYRVTSE